DSRGWVLHAAQAAAVGHVVDTEPRTMISSRLLWRLASLCVLMIAYYALDWRVVRIGQRSACAAALKCAGYESKVVARIPADAPFEDGNAYERLMDRIAHKDDGTVALLVNGLLLSITPDCTYLDLVLIIAPFLWRPRLRWRSNFVRLGVMSAAVF